ncbi:MAG: MlaD family protein [Opitutaceae bacterium]
MSKKANPTTVGLFVIIGIALLVTGVITFSEFRMSGVTEKFILYFDSSVKGLSVGAPVTHRGVKIGTVTDIQLRFNQADDDFAVPVFIELEQSLIRNRSDRKIAIKDQSLIETLIGEGLRGRLEAGSFVTGQLYIELALGQDAPPAVLHQLKPVMIEIPTMSSGIQAMMEKLGSVDVEGIANKLTSILEQLDQKVGDLQVSEISDNLNQVLASLNKLLDDPNLGLAINRVSDTLEDFKATSAALRGEVGSVSKDISVTLDSISKAIDEMRDGMADVRHTLSADSVLAHNLGLALEQFADASTSVSELAEFLRLHPNALISGREKQPANP